MEEIRHGGDCYRNQVRLDFSVNINPLGCPDPVTEALKQAMGQTMCYPDPKAQELRDQLALRLEASPRELLPGNGASELLMAVFHALRPKQVILPVPSFSGYRRAIEAIRAERIYYDLKEEDGYEMKEDFLQILEKTASVQTAAAEDGKSCDSGQQKLLILTNPNNPTGRYIPHPLLERILDLCEKLGIYVLLDECFMELSSHPEENTCLRNRKRWPHVMILRAFTKSFAIPGVRLGYLVCEDPELAEAVQKQLPEWNLSVFAQAAGIAALQEADYLEKTLVLLARERGYLTSELERLGFTVCPSQTDFLLFYPGHNLYPALLEKGILIRDCSDYPGLSEGTYRVAVKTHEENTELIRELEQILRGKETIS